ncbi:MAG: 3-keto-5-aminohexanoate cleavage protein [Candidatus Dormibacteraeota bacterium]|nr:3-keto-5-aminohexanoate cleavage protein [Candidatus Dormibacteraeota bacterium]
MLLQACLNGSRGPADHPAIPVTPDELAADAAASVRAGAGALHIHPRGIDMTESIAASDVAAVCTAARAACPGIPVGVTTAAWIEPDLQRRPLAIAAWTVLPDYASVNLAEAGALDVISLLNEKGVRAEAGIWTADDARLFIAEGLDGAVLRILVEVDALEEPDAAVALAKRIDRVLDDGLVRAPRLHHGDGRATWWVIQAAMEDQHDVRIGFEDTLVDMHGEIPPDNAALVSQVVQIAARSGRSAGPPLV